MEAFLAALTIGVVSCFAVTLSLVPGKQLAPWLVRLWDRVYPGTVLRGERVVARARRVRALHVVVGAGVLVCTALAAVGNPVPVERVEQGVHGVHRCLEDMPCWNCHHMGNHVCGGGMRRTGFDTPWHHSFRPHLVHRCPKLSNPIECTGNDRSAHKRRERSYTVTVHASGTARCVRLRLAYLLRHGVGGRPRGLHGHGCSMWAADARYHRAHGAPFATSARGAAWGVVR